jgi:hypothetical protein
MLSQDRRVNRWPALKDSKNSLQLSIMALSVAGFSAAALTDAQAQAPMPAEDTAAAVADPSWEVPRFSWGDPNLEGTFTSRDMSGVPMQRPEQFGTRQ